MPSEGRAKIDSNVQEVDKVEVDGLEIPILALQEKKIIGLPGPEEGVMLIVSGIVATAAQREDVVAPSRVEREQGTGRVKECRAFVRPSPIQGEE